jgi:hypothetical protein
MANIGNQIFISEFHVALSRLEDKDLNDHKTRARAIELLRPFDDLAKQVGLEEDEDLNELWSSLRQAEEGDATAFKSLVSDWIATAKEQAQQAGEDSEEANNSF